MIEIDGKLQLLRLRRTASFPENGAIGTNPLYRASIYSFAIKPEQQVREQRRAFGSTRLRNRLGEGVASASWRHAAGPPSPLAGREWRQFTTCYLTAIWRRRNEACGGHYGRAIGRAARSAIRARGPERDGTTRPVLARSAKARARSCGQSYDAR